MADDRLQVRPEPHPLDHEGGDSDLWRLHRGLVTLSAELARLARDCRRYSEAMRDYDPPQTHEDAQARIRQEEH